MKTLLIHIGYHKTATSSLQKFLTDNAVTLRSHGVNYASSGFAGTSHSALANGLKPEGTNRPETRQLWRALLKEVEVSKSPATLISSECFLESKGIPAVLAPMLDGKVQVRIVCYLRPQLDWLESAYNEIVKDPYRRYTGDLISMREIRGGWHDYHAILSLWSGVFGREAMCVRPFEKSKLKDGNIYEDFLDVLQINSIAEFVLPEMQNVSLHPSLTEFLRRCNTIPMTNFLYQPLVLALQTISIQCSDELPKLAQPFGRVALSEQETLLSTIRKSNVALNQEFGSGNGACFFSSRELQPLPLVDEDELLPCDAEHEIFNFLPTRIQSNLEERSHCVATRKAGQRFLPLPQKSLEGRLRATIIRQRIEARELYSLLPSYQPTVVRSILLHIRRIIVRLKSIFPSR